MEPLLRYVVDKFSRAETKFKKLNERFKAGVITEAEFKAQLEKLMIKDKQGRWWMIGYETGLWYYHDGEKWVPGEPPKARLTPLWIGGIGVLALLTVLVIALTRSGGPGGLVSPTPAPPPTATQLPPTTTLVPPTTTPVPPTATITPRSTATTAPLTATSTAPPTATQVPPTATLVPPTATPVPPTATRALPTPSPPPGSNGVPLLATPANGQEFSEATQAIELSWQAVGDLAADEFYDVYLTWRAGGKRVEKHWYRQETRLVVGREYFGLSDDGRYEWNVVVRRGQSPDAGQLSPISEQRFFLWRPRSAAPPTWTPTKQPPPTP